MHQLIQYPFIKASSAYQYAKKIWMIPNICIKSMQSTNSKINTLCTNRWSNQLQLCSTANNQFVIYRCNKWFWITSHISTGKAFSLRMAEAAVAPPLTRRQSSRQLLKRKATNVSDISCKESLFVEVFLDSKLNATKINNY